MSRGLRTLVAGVAIATATVAGSVAPSVAAEGAAKPSQSIERAYPGESFSQYYRRGYGGGYRRGGGGGAVAAGVIGGLAVGALAGAAIAGSQPAYGYPAYGYGPGVPVGNVYGHDPEWVNYCASRYRSFDPASGTYLARDGNRYMCE